MANACGIFETERYQPILVCASASPFSILIFLISNGMSTRPIPCSSGASCLGSGTKSDKMVGATLLCRQATTLPSLSSPASRRSADTVW